MSEEPHFELFTGDERRDDGAAEENVKGRDDGHNNQSDLPLPHVRAPAHHKRRHERKRADSRVCLT